MPRNTFKTIKRCSLFIGVTLFLTSCEKDPAVALTYTGSFNNWMSTLLQEHPEKNITLYDICIPRSHDAGTYLLSQCTMWANACNTQTQHLSMLEQLEAGIRSFDVRPVLLDGTYYTQHTVTCGGLGCQGDLIASMLAQTKQFLDAQPELVILELGHFCQTNAHETGLRNIIENTLGDRIYREEATDNRRFIQRPLEEIIDLEDGKGKVLLIHDGVQDNAANREKGIFSHSYFRRSGGWSNKFIFEELKEDQLRRYSNFNNDGSRLFEFSWTLTQNDSLAVNCAFETPDSTSIRTLAGFANEALKPSMDDLISAGSIRKGLIPHILSVDFADRFVTEQCLRLSLLNLQ